MTANKTNASNELTTLLNTLRTLAETDPAVMSKLRAIADAADTTNDAETFRKAYEKLAFGRRTGCIHICNMRKELGWDTERFDEMLRKLRRDAAIHLHAGDPLDFTAEELKMSFTDEYGSFYTNLTWRRA